MTTSRVQTNRNIATGGVPAAGTRRPGELYSNIADLQLGLIDEAQTPRNLLAVTFFAVTANYPTGAFVVYNGALYVSNSAVFAAPFDPTHWTKIGP